METRTASPYTLEDPPTSTGRVLLARALEHWCALHHGHRPEELAAALGQHGVCDPTTRRQVRSAARLLGELMAAAEIRSFARPFGGGSPANLPAAVWERDDFAPIFAHSALDPERPFEHDANPTHWVFLDLGDFNRIVELSCGDLRRPSAPAPSEASSPWPDLPASRADDRHVRMPEVERRTGLSRATIYRRIEQGRFPRQIPMDGNVAAWWERDVAQWLADPR